MNSIQALTFFLSVVKVLNSGVRYVRSVKKILTINHTHIAPFGSSTHTHSNAIQIKHPAGEPDPAERPSRIPASQ